MRIMSPVYGRGIQMFPPLSAAAFELWRAPGTVPSLVRAPFAARATT